MPNPFCFFLTFYHYLPLMSILSVNNLSKRYGPIQALNNVSFDVPKGSTFGILGPNGSGKTTLLGIVMDIIKATSGNYNWLGHPGSEAQRKQIGTLLETPNFYHYLSGETNLRIAAEIKGHGQDDIHDVLKMVNLYDRRKSKFNTYSLGMKQRLAIASAMLGDPEILIFDEPTVGLDPEERVRFRNLISDLANDCIVILSSHIVSDIETIADEVAIMKSGHLVTKGLQADIIEEVRGKVFEFEINSAELKHFKEKFLVISTIRRKEKLLVRFIADGEQKGVTHCPASLEDAYLNFTK